MNNLKYYNDSLAYDFEMFMPKEAKRANNRDNIVVMPINNAAAKKRKRTAAKRLSAPATLVMCAVFILAGFCGNIALRLQINEVNSQINDVKSSIAQLDSEKTTLEVELQRRMSYENLELKATELGMIKPEKDSIVYIEINDKNAARIADGSFVYE